MTFKEILKNNAIFIISLVCILIALCYFIFSYNKIEINLMFNQYHTTSLDTFFKYLTYLGGGFGAYFAIIALLFFNLKSGLFLLISQGFSWLISFTIKITAQHPRPITHFREMGIDLPPTVDGVHIYDAYNSFPSGHTVAIFAFCFSMSLLTSNKYKYLQFLWLALAIIASYSRIYLSQHFLQDTMLGSLIGTFGTLFIFWIFYSKYPNTSTKSLYKIIRKQ